jgi:putative oxidoreductase
LEGEDTMADTASSGSGAHLIISPLGGLYDGLRPLTLPVLRVATGLWFLPHGMQKLFGAFGGFGMEATAGWLGSQGYANPQVLVWVIALLEVLGGIALAIGFLTRPVAVAFLIFLVAIALFHAPNGFFWVAAGGGVEYALLWAFAVLVFAVRGGGDYSVDKAIGREF